MNWIRSVFKQYCRWSDHKKHDLENLSKEEADHFDMQSPITIQVADKEKIGRIETGHHKMKVSAIYNIKSFKFND